MKRKHENRKARALVKEKDLRRSKRIDIREGILYTVLKSRRV